MALNAKSRLDAPPLLGSFAHLPTRNGTIRGYLIAMAQMLVGDRPVGRDCRATVVRYLVSHPDAGGYILIVGRAEDNTVYHTFLVDPTGHKLADAYNGAILKDQYLHMSNGERVSNPIVAFVDVKVFMHHVLRESDFETWVKQYPN